jgi:hypothetical protein
MSQISTPVFSEHMHKSNPLPYNPNAEMFRNEGLLQLLAATIQYDWTIKNKFSRLSDPCEKHRKLHKRCPINCKDRKIVPKEFGISKK